MSSAIVQKVSAGIWLVCNVPYFIKSLRQIKKNGRANLSITSVILWCRYLINGWVFLYETKLVRWDDFIIAYSRWSCFLDKLLTAQEIYFPTLLILANIFILETVCLLHIKNVVKSDQNSNKEQTWCIPTNIIPIPKTARVRNSIIYGSETIIFNNLPAELRAIMENQSCK